MGRAIARKPSLFLFDEPLSNLDAKLRLTMRAEIKRLHAKLKTTIVYVTHDQVEAMTLGTHIAILKDGLIQQFDSPMQIYKHPINKFVASFIGAPSMNFIPIKLIEKDNQLFFTLENTNKEKFTLPVMPDKVDQLQKYINKEVILGVRPEFIQDGYRDSEIRKHAQTITATVDLLELTGPDALEFVMINNTQVVCRTSQSGFTHTGEISHLQILMSEVLFFDCDTDKNIHT